MKPTLYTSPPTTLICWFWPWTTPDALSWFACSRSSPPPLEDPLPDAPASPLPSGARPTMTRVCSLPVCFVSPREGNAGNSSKGACTCGRKQRRHLKPHRIGVNRENVVPEKSSSPWKNPTSRAPRKHESRDVEERSHDSQLRAHYAHTTPSTLPTQFPVKKLARERKSASAAAMLPRARPSLAFSTTSSSSTSSELSISTIPQTSHGFQR